MLDKTLGVLLPLGGDPMKPPLIRREGDVSGEELVLLTPPLASARARRCAASSLMLLARPCVQYVVCVI